MDVAVSDGVCRCLICSMESSDAACVDSEAREGDSWCGSGLSAPILRVATLPVMRSRVGLDSWGMLMPRSSAVRRKCWSISSSVWSSRRTMMR